MFHTKASTLTSQAVGILIIFIKFGSLTIESGSGSDTLQEDSAYNDRRIQAAVRVRGITGHAWADAWSVRSIDATGWGGNKEKWAEAIQRLDGGGRTGQDKKDEDGKEDIR